MINLHGLHQTLERRQRPTDVQQLDAAVVQQLVALVGQQGTHGDPCELLSWRRRRRRMLIHDEDTFYPNKSK